MTRLLRRQNPPFATATHPFTSPSYRFVGGRRYHRRVTAPPSPATATAELSSARPQWRLWLLAATGVWVLQTLAIASAFSPTGYGWPRALAVLAADAMRWIPAQLMLYWVAHRCPFQRPRAAQRLLAHAGAVGMAIVWSSALRRVFAPLADPSAPPDPFLQMLADGFAGSAVRFTLMLGLGHAFVYAQRARLREAQLEQAQLQYLRAQLQPHFLFNALNTVSSLVHTDPERATVMISRLGIMLRRALEQDGASIVPLRDEVRLLEAYLDVEQARFEDRLYVRWAIDTATLDALVPHLLLQPIVENAVRHGIAPQSAPGCIRITAVRDAAWLTLTVEDDGVGLRDPAGELGPGVGLPNTRSRLQHLYGDAHRFTLSGVHPHGVRVEVAVPWRERVAA
jgi:two-component system, LytTR family, sensor kinase